MVIFISHTLPQLCLKSQSKTQCIEKINYLFLLRCLHIGWGSVGLDLIQLGLALGCRLDPIFLIYPSSFLEQQLSFSKQKHKRKTSTFQSHFQLLASCLYFLLKSHMTGPKLRCREIHSPYRIMGNGCIFLNNNSIYHTCQNQYLVFGSSQSVKSINFLQDIFLSMPHVNSKGHHLWYSCQMESLHLKLSILTWVLGQKAETFQSNQSLNVSKFLYDISLQLFFICCIVSEPSVPNPLFYLSYIATQIMSKFKSCPTQISLHIISACL